VPGGRQPRPHDPAPDVEVLELWADGSRLPLLSPRRLHGRALTDHLIDTRILCMQELGRDRGADSATEEEACGEASQGIQ